MATRYTNAALGLSGQTTSGVATYWTRTPGGRLVSQRNADGTRWYSLFDGLGSVVGMVDVGGTVVARYAYDPYGQTVVQTGPAAEGNPWRYTGGYWDAGVGLYKLGARYYDPARGRFTQPDPLGGGYVYASDNPVNFVDPTGLGICGLGHENQPFEDSGECGGGGAYPGPRGFRNGTPPNSFIPDYSYGDGEGWPIGGPIRGYGPEPFGGGRSDFRVRGITPDAVRNAARGVPERDFNAPAGTSRSLYIGEDGLILVIDDGDGIVVTGFYDTPGGVNPALLP